MFELSFSKNIKKFREDHNLSQKKFAEMIQVSRTTLIAYEKGSVEPTLYVLFRIAKIMDCSLDSLVGIDNPANKANLYSKLDDKKSLELETSIKYKINTLNELISKYRRSFDELTMSKKKTDKIADELTMSKKKTDKIADELALSKKKTDRMFNELAMVKKRNDLVYEELKRTVNRLNKSEDAFTNIVDDYYINQLNLAVDNEYTYISIPEFGSIACGPLNEIEDNLINYIELPIIDPLRSADSKNYFIITAAGNSMNNIIKDGEQIILKSTPYGYIPNQGDILAISVNNSITLKELYLNDNKLILRPNSDDPSYTEIVYDSNEFNNLELKGKFICTVNKIKELNK